MKAEKIGDEREGDSQDNFNILYVHIWVSFFIPKMVENKESPCLLLCIKKLGFFLKMVEK